MNRRPLVLGPCASLITAPPLLLHTGPSSAAVPWVVSLLLGRMVRGTLTRTVTTQVARTMVVAPRALMQVAGLAAVTAGVAVAYREVRAHGLWLTGDTRHPVKFSAAPSELEQPDLQRLRHAVYMGLRVRDQVSGAVEYQSVPKAVYVGPRLPLNLQEVVTDLRVAGTKLVEGFATRDPKGREPHPAFRFPEPRTVLVASPEDVRWERP
jgi:hypothetical protein